MSCSWIGAVKTAWKTHRLPGIAVGIWNGGDEQYFVFGRQGLFGSPVNPETVYAIASVSKSFIAASAWILAEEKRLDMEVPVSAYLPGFSLYTEEMTREILVKDLFSHYTGLPRHDISVFTGQNESLEETVRRVRYLQPAWPVHTHFGYSNHMFAVASLLVEKISGIPWGEFVSERIFKPLGMKRSYTKTLVFRDVDDNYARPMANVRGFNVPVKPMNTGAYGCSGSLSASVRDLLAWTVTNLHRGVSPGGARLFSEAAAGELHGRKTPIRSGESGSYTPEEVTGQFYGMGWFVEKFRGETLVNHGGTIPGYKSQIGFLPEKDFAFAILTNSSNTSACTALQYHLCDMRLGHPEFDWNRRFLEVQKKMRKEMESNYRRHLTALEAPGDPLGCGGRYRNGAYGEFTVLEKGKKLRMRVEAVPRVYSLAPAAGGYTLLLPSERLAFPCRFERDDEKVKPPKAARLLVKMDPFLNDYIPFDRVGD
ncbi:MAG: beta-lactamase family protein [Treponema sp.]|jgi:CubicO group peptidase (beta-lactamase class C family)|nr:beta-lactamase family protein [Treponema sp.]